MPAGGSTDGGYDAEVEIAASVGTVYDALTTLAGLAAWWTPAVSGRSAEGGELTFSFAEELVVMRVDQLVARRRVCWTCLVHTKFPEWRGTTLAFDLDERGPESTVVAFGHVGLVADLECYGMCSRGWAHYLDSLVSYASGHGGSPWGTDTWRPARA
jgi:uncharacterized protein YndB with AHSA1/START domain